MQMWRNLHFARKEHARSLCIELCADIRWPLVSLDWGNCGPPWLSLGVGIAWPGVAGALVCGKCQMFTNGTHGHLLCSPCEKTVYRSVSSCDEVYLKPPVVRSPVKTIVLLTGLMSVSL